MKLFAPALIFCGAAFVGFGQSPQVPHKLQFAGMTLTLRDDARREIQTDVDALTRSPKYFGIKAERAKTYFPIIEAAFAEERLPDDFKYLALQESALVPDAVSTSNAVGFWQFKAEAAAEMGLRVDREVDERMNIASASRAAARYLKRNNHYFNNWVYALQAYNMGAGGVMRAVGDKDLGTRHMEINSETHWYVKKYLAHKVAFEGVSGQPQVSVLAFRDAGGKTLEEISRSVSADVESIRSFNKWLKADQVPTDKEYLVLVPSGEATAEFGVLSVATAAPTTSSSKIEKVEPHEINGIPVIQAKAGETLGSLVARSGMSMSRFLNLNEMDIDRPVRVGASYFLGKKKKHAAQELYTVAPGEDLWAVSQRFGVRMKSLVKYNDLNAATASVAGYTLYLAFHRPETVAVVPDSAVAELDGAVAFDWDLSLSPGKGLTAVADPKPTPSLDSTKEVPKTSSSRVHEVKPTDTLYSVARQYGVTIREIMEWNGKKDFGLSVGEKLKVAAR